MSLTRFRCANPLRARKKRRAADRAASPYALCRVDLVGVVLIFVQASFAGSTVIVYLPATEETRV